jgi:hypothetical protein
MTRRASHSQRPASRPALTEAAFQAAIIELATLAGWLCHHEYDSRRSTPGYPDLTLCKPPRLLLIELKTQRGRVRPEQREWLAALAECPGVEVALWRPSDWPAIEAALLHGAPLGTTATERQP